MVKTIVGKMNGEEMILYSPGQYVETHGEPMVDDIVEINGKIYAYKWHGRVDITHEFGPDLGLPFVKEDYL